MGLEYEYCAGSGQGPDDSYALGSRGESCSWALRGLWYFLNVGFLGLFQRRGPNSVSKPRVLEKRAVLNTKGKGGAAIAARLGSGQEAHVDDSFVSTGQSRGHPMLKRIEDMVLKSV